MSYGKFFLIPKYYSAPLNIMCKRSCFMNNAYKNLSLLFFRYLRTLLILCMNFFLGLYLFFIRKRFLKRKFHLLVFLFIYHQLSFSSNPFNFITYFPSWIACFSNVAHEVTFYFFKVCQSWHSQNILMQNI